MLIPTVSQLGSWTRTVVNAAGEAQTTQGTRRKESVSGTSSAIIHGDMKNPNPWSFTVSIDESVHGSVRYTTNTGVTSTTTGVLSTSSNLTTWKTAQAKAFQIADGLAIDGLLSHLQTISDHASNYAEGGLRHGVMTTLQAADDARRQADTGWNHRTIARAWLSMQYLWKPAINDIYNVVDAVSGNLTRKGMKVWATGLHSEGFEPDLIGADGWNFKVPVTGSVNARVKYSARLRVNPWLDIAAQLTSLDPLVILWEKVPYSFVVDWFYNVGGYLANLEAAARYNSAYIGGSGFKSYSHLVSAGVSHYGTSTQTTPIYGNLNCRYTEKRLVRTILSGLPTPHPPSLNMNLGSGTMLNAAALLASKLRPGFYKVPPKKGKK